jgi:outer membrane protein OmpA-like peptidoglycan-associated protein
MRSPLPIIPALFLTLTLVTAVRSQEAPASGTGAWANFDYVPGQRIIFSDDLSNDRVGNFPQRFEQVDGNLEVVTWRGQRMLRATSEPAFFDIVLPEKLPQRFTIEFDYATGDSRIAASWVAGITGATDPEFEGAPVMDDQVSSPAIRGMPHTIVVFGPHRAGAGGGGVAASKQISNANDDALVDQLFRIRVQVDGKYMKVYVDENRVANLPSSNFARTNRLRFFTYGSDEGPSLFGNFIIAAGGQSLYDALLADGRVVTQGIYFDVNSDRIRPESGPTLKLITDMLTAHPELKLTVEGHTDNTGNAAANLTLSERRAKAIVGYLTTTGGIAAARLTGKGLGASKPAASNDTNEGRQQNRRVELVKA